LRYEDLVQAPCLTLGRIAGFLGLDPATLPIEAVLRENDAALPEPMPAYAAARQRLHTRSLYRHQAFIRAAPVEKILAPWIAELGYGEAA
jgi:hypothetical protein